MVFSRQGNLASIGKVENDMDSIEELLRFLRRLAVDREIEARALRTYVDLLEKDSNQIAALREKGRERKYNSVASVCFTVHHDEFDGSDLTLGVLWLALLKRCLGIQAEFEEGAGKRYKGVQRVHWLLGEVFELDDTTENQEE